MQYAGGILQATSSKTGGPQYLNKSGRYLVFAEAKGEWESRLADTKARYEGVENADPEREVIAVVTSEFDGSKASKYPHGWLDNTGKNAWEYWKTYIQDKNNTIWEATLNVANTADGEKILYDISPIKKVGQSGNSDTSLFKDNVPQNGESVKYSFSDSDGKQLTKEQQEYFKDSKMRDENGNLKVMYHGSQDAGIWPEVRC